MEGFQRLAFGGGPGGSAPWPSFLHPITLDRPAAKLTVTIHVRKSGCAGKRSQRILQNAVRQRERCPTCCISCLSFRLLDAPIVVKPAPRQFIVVNGLRQFTFVHHIFYGSKPDLPLMVRQLGGDYLRWRPIPLFEFVRGTLSIDGIATPLPGHELAAAGYRRPNVGAWARRGVRQVSLPRDYANCSVIAA